MERNVVSYPLVASHWCDALGTTLRDFGRPEASEWFDRAVKGYREASAKFGGGVPSIKVALILWKAGRLPEATEECLRIQSWSSPLLGALGSEQQAHRSVWRAGEAATEAAFVLGDYRGARDLALTLRAASVRAFGPDTTPRSSDCEGVFLLSEGMVMRDQGQFEQGLDALSDQIEEWPTPRCSTREDLFRLGLSLPMSNTDAYIRWRLQGAVSDPQ
jgi:hypothetical protein